MLLLFLGGCSRWRRRGHSTWRRGDCSSPVSFQTPILVGPIPQQKHHPVLHPPFMPSRSALPDHCGRRRTAWSWSPLLLVATFTGPWHESRIVAGWQLLAERRGPAPAWLWAPTAGAGPPPMPEQHLAPSALGTHGIIESFRWKRSIRSTRPTIT